MKPYYQDNHVTIYHGDVLDCLAGMPEESVQCVVTSPPYWGLRDYGQDGQLGLEQTPEEYVTKMVEVFREVRRVLREDGVLWLNLGDSYASNPASGGPQSEKLKGPQNATPDRPEWKRPPGLKPKDLVGIPWRVALALQAEGWYLRSDVIWSKNNPMPESATDRPTRAHEYVFLLTKAARYFYDADAVREKGADCDGRSRGKRVYEGMGTVEVGWSKEYRANPAGRNKRTVWEIATQPCKEAHFATMPEKLVEPCILAGTSAKGACPECGAPWTRVVEKEKVKQCGVTPKQQGYRDQGIASSKSTIGRTKAWDKNEGQTTTVGWRPTCDHGADPVPCVVLDPFLGAGTVATVAKRHNRRAVGCDLNAEYLDMAIRRIQREGCQLSLTG